MTQWVRNQPVRRKFTAIIVFTTVLALVLSSVGVIIWDDIGARRKLPHDLQGMAGIVATNVESALDFDDVEAATRTLTNLQSEHAITGAAIYTAKGALFARYHRPGDSTALPAFAPGVGVHFRDGSLDVVIPIVRGGESIGRVFVTAELRALRERRQGLIGIVAAVLVASMLLALLFGGLAQGLITHRLMQLANVAKAVTAKQDYSVRAVHDGADEVGDLILAFNRMLDEIGKRDSDLRDAQENLERRVADRTVELRAEIAERERTEQELRVANDAAQAAVRAKSEFLATMSHEIRTPMNGVLGMTNLVLASPLTDSQRELVHTIRSSGESLLTIINDILDFSRVEAGQLRIESVEFDVPTLVTGCVETLAPVAKGKGIELNCDIRESARRTLAADPTRLRQVLLNLMGNAIKFTTEGTVDLTVEVRTDASDGTLWLRADVYDTGIGIAPEAQTQLFAPFTQADSSTSRRFGGTGLGLAITRRLVELMNGDVGLESEVGHGSHFWFSVRCSAAVSPAPASRSAIEQITANIENARFRGRRVLLAEDNIVNQRVAVGYLSLLGCTIDVVENGEQAVRAAEHGTYDLVLMDCMMPEMDGNVATSRIRAIEANTDRRVPIVALTASALEGERERCLACGMDDFLTKPFHLADLRHALEQWCSREELSTPHAPAIAVEDVQAILALPDGHTVLREALAVYDREGTQTLSVLRRAAEVGDRLYLRRSAQALCSESTMLGASGMAAQLLEIAQRADFEPIETLQHRVHGLSSAFTQSVEALGRHAA